MNCSPARPRPRPARSTRPRRVDQSGLALVESLVGLLVLAVGVLGALYFQGFMVAAATGSTQRIEASLLAEELVAMAHSDAANAGCYALTSTAPCASPSASAYLSTWRARVMSSLPGADSLEPTVQFSADRTFTVTLQWRQKETGTVRNHTLATQIRS
jgi:type IV pilus assembly protein PilV